jgi:Tfp pilus assembly protein PilF
MTATAPASENFSDRRAALTALALALAACALYAPALSHDFLPFDDQIYVTENRHVQSGLTWSSILWAFQTFRTGNWHPATWISHLIDCQLYGLRPWGHHLSGVLLHGANTGLLFLVLRKMTAAAWPSLVCAALFGLHPAHVESVAWVAERKDVLSALFFLLTLYLYARHASRPRALTYAAALGCFAAGLMAKSMLVTLPFVLLLLDYWPLQRRAWLEKIPFFILSAIFSGVTLLAQSRAHAIANTERWPIAERFANAAVSYVRYIGELIFPHDLAVFYPYENVSTASAVIACALLVTISALVIYGRRRFPFGLVGWLWFVGMLVPVIGLIQVGSQAMADRYTYLPSIGFFLALVWWSRPILKYAAPPILILLAVATSIQLSYWRDGRTLFTHTAKVTKNNALALGILASINDSEGKLADAEQNCHEALAIDKNNSPAWFFLGRIREKQGRLDDAIAAYQRAVELTPYFEQARLVLGVALVNKKDFAGAETNYLAAEQINPESASAHNNLGKLRQLQGRLDDSRAEYETALLLDPQLAQAHNNLAIIFLQQGDAAHGIAQLELALKLSPTNAQTVLNLATALSQQNQWADAANRLLQTAAADSRVGIFDQALALAARAASIARDHGDAATVAKAEQMMTALRAAQPVNSP